MPNDIADPVRLSARVDAPATLVFDLLAAVEEWVPFHGPAVHTEQTGGLHNGAPVTRHWWVVDDHTVRVWDAAWTPDRAELTVTYRGVGATGPSYGIWTVTELPDARCELAVEHRAVDGDETYGGLGPQSLLDDVVLAAENADARRDLVVDFEDELFVAGALDDCYAYLYEAQKWPERIPHVARLDLQEPGENIQFFDMDTSTSDGHPHTTRSVRICRPGDRILYKQIHLPALLDGHTGHWNFTQTREGVVIGARHTATIKPSALPLLGKGTTVLDARKYLRRVLSTNSMGNLRLTKQHAEERAGV